MNTQNKIDQDIYENLLFLLVDHISNKCQDDSLHKAEQAVCSASFPETKKDQLSEQLKNFMDQMPGGFFIYHADGNEEIIYANAAILRMFNCDTMEQFKELTGNSFRGIVHPDDLETVEQSIVEQIANNKYALDYVEYRIVTRDGEVRWIEDYGHFTHTDSMGDIFYVFAADATEKKKRKRRERETLLNEKQEKELLLQKQVDEYSKELKIIHQEQLRRLEIIEGLSIDYESIFYVDLDENWMKAYRISKRFAKKFPSENFVCAFKGFDKEYIEEWVYPDDRELLKGIDDPEFIRAQLSQNKIFHVNYRIFRDGRIAYIQLRMVNLGSDDHISQIIIGVRNIDDEVIQEMEQKNVLENALNDANMANNAKNLFLSNMSHDIRTPMNAIVGFTSLIKRHIHDREKISGYLDMISASSEQLLQLLSDVLEISRLESANIHLSEEECSLMEIAHQVQMDILPRAAAKNVSVSLDISHLKHDIVRTDQMKLSQILTYIVDNAVKYTKTDGWVTITVIETDKEGSKDNHALYQFIVEDNGIGISEEFLEHIFEPFEREKNTTLSGIHGTGLGLTITKRLIEVLGGTIQAASVIGEGTRFTVTLPLLIQTDSVRTSDVEETPVRFSTSKRILVVDDNEINLEIENEVLKDAGFLVDTAGDGSIALEKIKQSKPGDYDLILMDIQMPIMDGYHATRAIREIDNPALAGIPIIAVSANAFEEDKKMAIESGMNAHLPKPLDTPLLYKMIRKFLKDDKKAANMDEAVIRPIRKEEYPYLEDFLYDAIYLPDNTAMPSRDIIKKPELAVYIEDFGGSDDFCLVAERGGVLLGAIWSRILSGKVKGYGNIGQDTPELAFSVKKDFRKQGLGTKLLKEMLVLLKEQGYANVSISVNKDNYAYHIYRKQGFQVVKVGEEDYLMVLDL
ncbi:MAG: GNAT family N-acetyltransferase [Lachnospiraceae bacterium]|nr:GNAT family N-acetyltransferase [Lachnospiraceae bacterium]